MADGGRRDGDLAVAYGEAQADDELRCRRHSYLGAEREVRIGDGSKPFYTRGGRR